MIPFAAAKAQITSQAAVAMTTSTVTAVTTISTAMAGFNVDLLTRTLTVAVEVDEDPKSEAVDTLNPGNDTIEGNDGVDIIFGDLGRIDQVAGTIRIANTGFVERIISTETGLGGNDDILGGRDIDYIIGGAGDDTVDGGADNNIVFGDAGDIQINILNGTPQDIAQLASVCRVMLVALTASLRCTVMISSSAGRVLT